MRGASVSKPQPKWQTQLENLAEHKDVSVFGPKHPADFGWTELDLAYATRLFLDQVGLTELRDKWVQMVLEGQGPHGGHLGDSVWCCTQCKKPWQEKSVEVKDGYFMCPHCGEIV